MPSVNIEDLRQYAEKLKSINFNDLKFKEAQDIREISQKQMPKIAKKSKI